MQNKELTASIVILKRVMADPELRPWQREKLRKGLRELKKMRRQGKLNRDKVFLATMWIADALEEERALASDSASEGLTSARLLQK